MVAVLDDESEAKMQKAGKVHSCTPQHGTAAQPQHSAVPQQHVALHCTALHCNALHCTALQRQVAWHRIAPYRTAPRTQGKVEGRGGGRSGPCRDLWLLVLGHFCISCIPRGGLTQAFERCLKNSAGVTVNIPRAHQWYVHMRPMEPLRTCACTCLPSACMHASRSHPDSPQCHDDGCYDS